MNDEFRVTLLWPGKRDFIAVAFWPGLESEQDPEVLVRRVVYGEDISLWGENFKGSQQSLPIFVPESDALVLSIIGEVIYIDTKLGDVTARYIISLDELVDWSADQEGTLCITGYHEEQKVLLAMSLAGEEKWRWVDRDKSDRWVPYQPPIRSGSRRVYALTGGCVLAIEQGNLLWQYKVKNGTPKHGSSLADGSLLVTAGKTLIHLDSAGNERFMVSLEDEILTPPVVDAEGNIYVATAAHLVKIK